MRRRSSSESSRAGSSRRDHVARDALHDVERRADHRLVVAAEQHARRAHVRVLERDEQPRLAQDVVGGGRQRRPRRAAQHELGVAAAHEVGHVRVALAHGLGLDRPAAEAVRVEAGLERPPDEQRRAIERGGLLRSVDDRGHAGAPEYAVGSLEGRNLGRSRGFRVQARPAGRSPRFRAGALMSRLPLAILLVLLAAFPAAAAASSTQSMTFEAPRELLDPAKRDGTLQEIRDLGVDRVRVLVYWRDYAPAPRRQAAPAPSTRPTRTPIRRAHGRAWTGCSTSRRRAA